MRRQLIIHGLVLAVISGCHGFGSVHLSEVATSSGKPSNVATIVAVSRKGEPVADLGVAAFSVSENDQVLDPQSVTLRALDPTTVVAFHTVLLVDLGHSTNDERKRQVSRAAAAFVRRVRPKQSVSVLAFDGAARARLVGEFSLEPNGTGPEQLDGLMQMASSDPSRNLNGAIVAALDALDASAERSGRAVNVGTIVVFSRGPDVAARVKDSDYFERIQNPNRKLVLIQVAGDPTNDRMTALDARGTLEAKSIDELPIAFENAAILVNQLASQYYLLSYCSPARAGERRLRVEVQVATAEGQVEADAFETAFDATGFAPNCNSNVPPKFVTTPRSQDEHSGSDRATAGNASSRSPTPGPTVETAPPSSAAPDSEPGENTPDASGNDIEVPPPKKRGYAP